MCKKNMFSIEQSCEVFSETFNVVTCLFGFCCQLLPGNSNVAPRVFLRHTLITKPNEHPGTLPSNLLRKWSDLQPLWICSLLGNAKRRKMPVALALFLQ